MSGAISTEISADSRSISTNTRTMSRSTYRSISRPTYLGRYIGRMTVDISTNISVDLSIGTLVECRSIYRHRSRDAQNTHDPFFVIVMRAQPEGVSSNFKYRHTKCSRVIFIVIGASVELFTVMIWLGLFWLR